MGMKIPGNVALIETPIARCWRSDDTLYLKAKNVPRTADNIVKHYEALSPLLQTGKMSWLLDLTDICQNFDLDARRIIGRELPGFCRALAIIADNPCAKMMSNYFQAIRDEMIPVQVFNTEEEAREWLKRVE